MSMSGHYDALDHRASMKQPEEPFIWLFNPRGRISTSTGLARQITSRAYDHTGFRIPSSWGGAAWLFPSNDRWGWSLKHSAALA
jgi:hypothetical protein